MIILAIETSCDETAIAVLSAKSSKHLGGPALGWEAKETGFKILSNIVSSQVELHTKWGGVVPSLAKREHIKNLPLVLEQALDEAKITRSDVDHIAVTVGPGLEPALWTGINFAEELSKKWGKPVLGINHMEGHILSVLLEQNTEFSISNVQFPMLALLVSGGHTELVIAKNWGKYKIIGATRDDAVGEAFDKVARMLGLPYPGGPVISELASKFSSTLAQKSSPTPSVLPSSPAGESSSTLGVIPDFKLPRPMMHSGDYDFSFSGLKTAVLYLVKNLKETNSGDKKYDSRRMPPSTKGGVLSPCPQWLRHKRCRREESRFLDEATIAKICHEFQQAVIDVLIYKTIKAVEEYGAETIILGGGVSANKELRRQLESAINKLETKPRWLVPSPSLSTDNAAMIAVAAYFNISSGKTSKLPLKAQGNLKLQ